MSNTNNRFFYGTTFTNITVVANCDNTEDGSIEASGSVFVDTIKRYNISSEGVNIENSIFGDGKVVITSTEPSLNISTGSLIVNGGTSILKDSRYYGTLNVHNTTDAVGFNLTSGSLIIDGGGSIRKNLNIGGTLTLYNTVNSISNNFGALVSLGGISIKNTSDAISITSGGALTISGGASIEKTLFANLLNVNNATISNSYLDNITNNNLYSSYGYIQELTTGNIINNYITTSSLFSNNSSISNLNLVYGTLGNILIDSEKVSNSSITNLHATTASIGNFLFTQGIIENLTIGNLHVNNNIEYNDIVTNLSTSNILSNYVTINSLLFTYGTFSNLYGTDLYAINLTSNNLNSTYISTSSLVTYNSRSINSTSANTFTNNATISNILSNNINATNSTITNLDNTNIISTNIKTTNLTCNNLININSSSIFTTSGFLNITGTIPSFNSSTGTVISYGGVSIDVIENATSITSGGGLTVAGGASIAKDVYIGYTLYVPNISSSNISSIYGTVSQLIGSDFNYTNGVLNNLYIGGTLPSLNSTTGSLVNYGGISINCTENTSSITNGGGLTVAGGASIAKNLLVGETISTSTITSGTIYSIEGNILDLSTTNITSTNLLVSNVTTSNIISITSNLLYSTIGSLYITDTTPSLNSTTASIVIKGGISIDNTTNATSISSGGGITISGGLAVNKDAYIGGNTWILGTLDLNSQIITNVTSPSNSLDVANKYYVDNLLRTYTTGNVSGNFTRGQVIIASTGGSIVGYSEFMYDVNQGSLYIYSTNDATSVSQGGSLQVSGGASVDKNFYVGGDAHILGKLDMNNQKITSVAIPTTYYDAANKYYVDNRFNEFTIGNVSGNFTQGQVIVASTLGNITGFDNFTFFNNTLSVFTTDEATNLTSGGVLNISGGARIQKSLYVGGPSLQIPVGDISSRPINAEGGYIRYNTETQQFEGYGAGNNWGSLGGVVDIAQTTKILASATPSTTDGNLYFYTVGNERLRINSSGNVGIGTSAPTAKLTVNGDLLVTSGINANSQVITNVTAPSVNLDVANKWYVDNRFNEFTIGNVSGNFTQGQVIVASTLGNITGFDNFTFFNNTLNIFTTNDATSLTSGGVLNIQGGARIAKNTFIGGPILQIPTGDISSRPINPVSGSIRYNTETQQFEGYGAGNNWGSLGGVIDIAQTTKILASATPSTTDGNLYFYTVGNERLRINSSGNVGIGTSAPTAKLTVNGDLLVTSGINANNQLITNVTAPSVDLDVANKWYVDNKLNQYTIGNVNGNFTQGQVIVASIAGSITGFNNFMFDGTKLSIYTTNDALGLTTGGVLKVDGGATIAKNVFIGGELDVNLNNIKHVRDPCDEFDAVNKRYVDNLLSENNESFIELDNNVTIRKNIPGFVIPCGSKAFIAYVYLTTSTTSSIYTLRGLKGSSNNWIMTSSFIGGNVHDTISFYINNNGLNTNIQYTNTATQGLTTITYKVTNSINNASSEIQTNISLNPNISIPQDIPQLLFSNANTNAFKLILYISSEIESKYSLVILNAVLKNNIWELNTYSIGNVDTIKFNIKSLPLSGQIQYTNSSLASDYTIKLQKSIVDNTLVEYTLNANTLIPSNIEKLDKLLKEHVKTHFLALLYVYFPSINKYSLYEIQGVVVNNLWYVNSRFIGDNMGLSFSIITTNNINYLSYKNPNNVNGYMRLVNANPLNSIALPVSKGGTSTTYLDEYSILRGNGIDKILGTGDLIYKDKILTLGNESSILLTNTQSSTNLTSGTLVSYGGISIQKNVRVGEELIVNNVNIKPLSDDILAERTFSPANNQTIPQNVDGFIFSNNSKSFNGTVCVTITTDTSTLDKLYDIKGLRKLSGWILNISSIGDDVGISFSITNLGQIQYTSTNITDWVSSTMKFRALTTSA
jgi:hypothetical protein